MRGSVRWDYVSWLNLIESAQEQSNPRTQGVQEHNGSVQEHQRPFFWDQTPLSAQR